MDEPAMVKAFRVVFIRTHEMPALIPNLDPSVIAALVPPHRRANGTGGDADGAADIDKDDGKAGACGFTLLDRFFRRLVRALPICVIVSLNKFEEIAVKDLRCFGGGLGILH